MGIQSHPVNRTIGVMKNIHGQDLFHGHSSIFLIILPPVASVSRKDGGKTYEGVLAF
jgi:hypothetical protein